jgi:hypothetical protein
VLALRDDHSLDTFGRDRFEADGEHVTGRVDHLDLLTHPGPQRASKVAGIAPLDYRAIALASRKKSWHRLFLVGHIASKVS